MPTAAIFAISLAGCDGTVTPPPARVASTSPTLAPTTKPTTTPTTSPTTSPTTAPTTAPTATPSSSPSTGPGAIVVNPASVAVYAVGSGCTTTATFTASEVNYTGTFSATSGNTQLATVAPAQSSGTFTVTATTANNAPASTAITISDTLGHTKTESVTIGVCLP